jgi:sec-independent protein translocase protein TatA
MSSLPVLNFIPTIQGMEWIVLIVVIVIVLFGAKKLPELARSIGKATGEFEKGKAEAEAEVQRLKQKLKGGKLTEEEEEEKLQKIAKDLGIETEGKTKEEIKEEIAKAMLK